MDVLFLLVPVSALVVLAVIGVFAWALHRGQFDNVEREGERIFEDDERRLDADQARSPRRLRK